MELLLCLVVVLTHAVLALREVPLILQILDMFHLECDHLTEVEVEQETENSSA